MNNLKLFEEFHPIPRNKEQFYEYIDNAFGMKDSCWPMTHRRDSIEVAEQTGLNADQWILAYRFVGNSGVAGVLRSKTLGMLQNAIEKYPYASLEPGKNYRLFSYDEKGELENQIDFIIILSLDAKDVVSFVKQNNALSKETLNKLAEKYPEEFHEMRGYIAGKNFGF